MKRLKIPLFEIEGSEEDIDAVSEVINRGTFWATGPEIERFEQAIADYVGRKYAVVFNSGTSALQIMLSAAGVQNEVIVPSMTFVATANSVVLAGGRPVFADIESDSLALDFDSVNSSISDNTSAVMIVHHSGNPARDVEKISRLCKDKGIMFFEDAAGALGAEIGGKKAGTFGDAAMFSFCQNKIITTGEGGVIVTDDPLLYDKMKLLRSHGRVEDPESSYFNNSGSNEYVEHGYNFRMPSMNAALGLSQLARVNSIIDRRLSVAEKLIGQLNQLSGVSFPVVSASKNVFQLFTIVLENQLVRDRLKSYLNETGIMSKVYFDPVHRMPRFKNASHNLVVTDDLAARVLSLPIYPKMTDGEIEFVTSKIKEFFENERTIRE